MQKQSWEGFCKKVNRNLVKLTRNHLCRNLFFNKVKLGTTGRRLLFIAVSIVVKGKLANETVNYDTKTKAYLPILARSVNY